MTPYEAWHGERPAVHFLRTFGCIGYVKNTRSHLKKLDGRATAMVLLGYEPGSKAYCLYDPVGERVHVSRDVVFDEDSSWNWCEGVDGGDPEPFLVEHVVTTRTLTHMASTPSASPTPALVSPAPAPGTPPTSTPTQQPSPDLRLAAAGSQGCMRTEARYAQGPLVWISLVSEGKIKDGRNVRV